MAGDRVAISHHLPDANSAGGLGLVLRRRISIRPVRSGDSPARPDPAIRLARVTSAGMRLSEILCDHAPCYDLASRVREPSDRYDGYLTKRLTYWLFFSG